MTRLKHKLALEKQYDYYVDHELELLKKYDGMSLVISDDLQINAFANPKEAFQYGEEHYGLGHFLLQRCAPGVLQIVNTVNCSF